MREYIKMLFNYWEAKRQQKKEIDLFLKTYNLKLIAKRETSIILGCLSAKPNKKTGKHDLVADDGTVLEADLSASEATKKIEEYKKAAKKKKIPLQQHLDELVDSTKIANYRARRLLEMKPPSYADARTGKAYRPHEIDSFIDLEIAFNGISRASRQNEAGDIIMETGKLAGKSLDPMGLAQGAIIPWQRNFNVQFDHFKRAIDGHFEKIHNPKAGLPPLDIVVLDFKYMDDINPNLKQMVIDYIESPTFGYKQYVNGNHLIKLNF